MDGNYILMILVNILIIDRTFCAPNCGDRNITCICEIDHRHNILTITRPQCPNGSDIKCKPCDKVPDEDRCKSHGNCILCLVDEKQCLKDKSANKTTCPDIGAPDNSKVGITFEVHRFEVGAVMEFECIEGFQIHGNKKLTCQETGQWSGLLPACERASPASTPSPKSSKPTSCPEPGIKTGLKRTSSFRSSPLEIGAFMEYSCVESLTLKGQTKITCLENGTWSAEPPSCFYDKNVTRTSCKDPGIPAAAQRQASYKFDQLEVGSQMKFSCYPGFILNGTNSIVCLENGTWSNSLPQCVKNVSCPDPDLPLGSTRKSFFRVDQFEVGARMEYSCGDGFNLQGPANISCTENGKWSSGPPKCVQKGH